LPAARSSSRIAACFTVALNPFFECFLLNLGKTIMNSANPVTLPLSGYSPRHFLLAIDNHVATVTLNRPERKNPLTFESYRELTDFFRACAFDDDVKAIVVSGAGGNFSSGGDVFEIIGPLVKMDTKGLTAFTRMTGDLVKAMRACPQPIVAAVEGICAGAGAIIAMASDMRLAATGAKVAFLFNKVGLAGCDMGACAILPRIIGQSRASELLYTGRFMTAEEGERWGFFSRIVPVADVLAQAQALARTVAEGPTFANTMTKRMLAMEWAMSVEEAIESEAIAQALCMTTQDFTRAFEAFARKEKPVFEGN
jgi:enoyl-CoA hydratase/carnithine racemase